MKTFRPHEQYSEAVSNRLSFTLPFFLGASQSFTYTASRMKTSCNIDQTDDKKGDDSQSSRENTRSETGFFNLYFRQHEDWANINEMLKSDIYRQQHRDIDYVIIRLKRLPDLGQHPSIGHVSAG